MNTKELMAMKPARHALIIMAMVLSDTPNTPRGAKKDNKLDKAQKQDDLPEQPTNNRPVIGEDNKGKPEASKKKLKKNP